MSAHSLNLISCIECGKKVSREANKCPHCNTLSFRGWQCYFCGARTTGNLCGRCGAHESILEPALNPHHVEQVKQKNLNSHRTSLNKICPACSSSIDFKFTGKAVTISSKMDKVTGAWTVEKKYPSDNSILKARFDIGVFNHFEFDCLECGHPIKIHNTEIADYRTAGSSCWICKEVILRGCGTESLLELLSLHELSSTIHFWGSGWDDEKITSFNSWMRKEFTELNQERIENSFIHLHQECADLFSPSWREELARKKIIKNEISSVRKKLAFISTLESGGNIYSGLVLGVLGFYIFFLSRGSDFWHRVGGSVFLFLGYCIVGALLQAFISEFTKGKLKAQLENLEKSFEKLLPRK